MGHGYPMSTRPTDAARPESAFVTALLRTRDVSACARVLSNRALEIVSATAAVVYVVDALDGATWSARGIAGPVEVEVNIEPAEASTLAAVATEQHAMLFSRSDLRPQSYSHLKTRRIVESLAYVPFVVNGLLAAVLEVISLDGDLRDDDLAALAALTEFAAPAVEQVLAIERERNSGLHALNRLSQLYDLEKTFHSTLEMDTLLPLISSKFRDVLSAQAVHVWMVKTEDELLLMTSDGHDPTVQPNASLKSGEGIAAEVCDSGEPLLVADPTDARLLKRNAENADSVFGLMAAPLIMNDEEVGVVEAVNKIDGTPFSEEDLFLLTSLCETAAGALHNASLLQAERKVEILEALVKVSNEITSTLDLERVLQAVVNNPATVIPYERAFVAMQRQGRVQLKAISGTTKNPSAPEFASLREMMEWASALDREMYIRQHGEEIDNDREETWLRARAYFEQSGMRGFYVFPLGDDQGRIGTFACESSDPDFLGDAHLEMIKIVATQATVALRNASLYQEVPFITALQPFLRQKQQFRHLEKRRQIALIAAAMAVIAALAIIPIPMRVEGGAAVLPAVSSKVQARVEGVVRRVLVREGQRVSFGDLLGELEDWGYRDSLAAAEAKYRSALAERNRALAVNDGSAAGVLQSQTDYWQSEVGRARERLDRTRLLAPHSGTVVTPHAEEFTGRHLDAGETFVEIADTSRTSVDVGVDEHDLQLLQAGESASLKLESFPTHTFQGLVEVMSPISYTSGEDRVYYARLDVPNSRGLMHSGMQGRAKILVGWRPIGYVLFRRPAMWAYTKIWSWVGW